jgi:hypothetical protein
MNLKLKLPIVENKNNKQLNFSLPKKKLSEELIKEIRKNKYIKLELTKQ